MREKTSVLNLFPRLRAATEPTILLLLLLSLVAGCDGRTVTMSFTHQSLKKIQVSGRINWEGKLDCKTLKVTAEPVPSSVSAAGRAVAEIRVPRPEQQGKPSALAYSFVDLPIVSQVKTTRMIKNRWGTVIGKPTVRYDVNTIKYHIIRVQAPAGWKSKPSEYKVSDDTKTANFVLEKMRKQF